MLVAFGLDGAENATVTLLLGAADDGGLRVEAAGPDPVPRDHWDNALWSLNEWNATVHVPKATLVGSADGADDANAHIVLQAWMPFTGDVPVTVVDNSSSTKVREDRFDWLDDRSSERPEWIAAFLEMKTVWHPIGV